MQIVLVVKHNVDYVTSHHPIKVLQQPHSTIRHALVSLATHIRALLFVVLRPYEEVRELESLSLTIKSMFCEREKVPALNINQQNDKSTQESLLLLIKNRWRLPCNILDICLLMLLILTCYCLLKLL